VDDAVGDLDVPVSGMQVAVTPFAQQHQVGDLRFASVDPTDHVVRIAI
jgi:hypothetical protein